MVRMIDLLPHDLMRLPPKERQLELVRLMKTLPKDDPTRKSIKIFINSQYGVCAYNQKT